MRWKVYDPNLRDRLGEKRVVRKFLWLPRFYKGKFAWLEYANIIERVCSFYDVRPGVGDILRWEEMGFSKEKDLTEIKVQEWDSKLKETNQ